MTPSRFVISQTEADERLDSALAAVAGISRSQARRWIDEGLNWNVSKNM